MPRNVWSIKSAIATAVIALSQVATPSLLFARELPAQSIQPAGTTYERAQVLDWINDNTFAIGRWDGSITVFRNSSGWRIRTYHHAGLSCPFGARYRNALCC